MAFVSSTAGLYRHPKACFHTGPMERTTAMLGELGCGSSANLSQPQQCAKPRRDLWLPTRDLASGPRTYTTERKGKRSFITSTAKSKTSA
ncbi:hypothetical protein EXN66_Car002026 [Channa argus]|uniref:Uncharacterized protein n=1 Tax=Channa argus TaxID=215402 RepID=A0A6G1P8A5_CHAAH|nr:hypothetical protein EXN66_Car002026 [Channa argus]